MSQYTVHIDPRVDARIEKDMQYLTKRILDTFIDVQAVILLGGFGRGEGTIKFSEGTPCPMNDYDIMIITKNKCASRKNLEILSRSMEKDIGIDFVDLGMMPVGQLGVLSPTIFNFEMKYGSYVIFGPKSITDLIPNYKDNDIPSREGMMLLMNRMGDILGRHSPLQNINMLAEKELEFLSIPLHKALLACGDSLLLMYGIYDASYRRRLAALEKLECRGELTFLSNADLKLIKFAYKEKLTPSHFVFKNPTNVLRKILPLYKTIFLRFVSYTLKIKCNTIQQSMQCFMQSERVEGTHFKERLKLLTRTNPKQWQRHWEKTGLHRNTLIYAALPSLLFSSPWIKKNDYSLLLFALDLIEYFQGQKLDRLSELELWDTARTIVFKCWKAIFH